MTLEKLQEQPMFSFGMWKIGWAAQTVRAVLPGQRFGVTEPALPPLEVGDLQKGTSRAGCSLPQGLWQPGVSTTLTERLPPIMRPQKGRCQQHLRDWGANKGKVG